MIMRDSSAAICHRYERRRGVGGSDRERKTERWREKGREERPSVQRPCHIPTITQVFGPQFNRDELGPLS